MALIPRPPRPRRPPVASQSRVAQGATTNEWRQWRAKDDRNSALNEGRQFVDEVTLPYSRNPTVQAAHAMVPPPILAQDPGKKRKGLLVRSTQSFDTEGTPRGPVSRLNVMGSYDVLQVQRDLRHELVDGTGHKRDSGDVSRLVNPTWSRTEDPSESRPYKRQATLDYLTLPSTRTTPTVPPRSVLCDPMGAASSFPERLIARQALIRCDGSLVPTATTTALCLEKTRRG